MEPIALTLGQQFDIEQRSRDINSMTDVKQLQEISKDLLLAWQKAVSYTHLTLPTNSGV